MDPSGIEKKGDIWSNDHVARMRVATRQKLHKTQVQSAGPWRWAWGPNRECPARRPGGLRRVVRLLLAFTQNTTNLLHEVKRVVHDDALDDLCCVWFVRKERGKMRVEP